MTTYLVTGATGLIGRHVVDLLLRNDNTDTVHVLVRPSSERKLAKTAKRWPNADKISPLFGDIAEPSLGLSQQTLEQLRGSVDHVVHLAALYDITTDDEANASANVDGTKHLLDVARAIEAGRVHHVSSVAVAGEYRGTFTEDMFDAGQPLPTPYHRTKYASEKLVREQHDVPWRVYRPAIVVGHSTTGEMDKVDGPYYLFPSIAALAPLPEIPFVAPNLGDTNLVPVDYVAAAMVHLMHRPGLDGRAFHLVNPQPQPLTEVYNVFANVAGAPPIAATIGKRASAPLLSLAKLAEQLPGASIARDAVLHRLGIPPEVLGVSAFTCRFDSTATREALAGSGIEVPRLDDYAGVLWG
ncbi:MAG: SDR family oxidoreductase, partial [Sciscionella sp.]|nr:SDR family oxidoreductase [Sciscionella sp.]